jgi:hypothetical protein
MHDPTDTRPSRTWTGAFQALPTADPPDLWPMIGKHVARGHRRAIAIIAVAALLVVAIALPWTLQPGTTPGPMHTAAAPLGATADDELETLYAQSAELETLLAYARDDRVASGSAETVAAHLDQELALIDAALGQPELPVARQRVLWKQRISTLRALASFESNRRLLSARGEHYDGALMRVD